MNNSVMNNIAMNNAAMNNAAMNNVAMFCGAAILGGEPAFRQASRTSPPGSGLAGRIAGPTLSLPFFTFRCAALFFCIQHTRVLQ